LNNFVGSEGANATVNMQTCTNLKLAQQNLGGINTQSEIDKNMDILKSAENLFKCSGICIVGKFYVFSDINRGIPEGPCYKQIYNFFMNIIESARGLAITGSVIMAISVLFVCCLCCHK
jgi:hypothetical protein